MIFYPTFIMSNGNLSLVGKICQIDTELHEKLPLNIFAMNSDCGGGGCCGEWVLFNIFTNMYVHTICK